IMAGPPSPAVRAWPTPLPNAEAGPPFRGREQFPFQRVQSIRTVRGDPVPPGAEAYETRKHQTFPNFHRGDTMKTLSRTALTLALAAMLAGQLAAQAPPEATAGGRTSVDLTVYNQS